MAKNGNRDEFSQATKNRLAKQARYHCSNPSCRHLTSAPTSDGEKDVNIGVAAHICAAAPGPGARRYRADMTPEQRKSHENGIWLCQDCAKAIDSDDPAFSETVLHGWKRKHAEDMWRSIIHKVPFGPTMPPTVGEIGARLQKAAAADLEVFKRSSKWPRTNVSLMLEVKGQPEPVLASALGQTLGTLDDLVIVAAPGTGKTSALFQLAEASVSAASGTPLVVSLSDWSTGGLTLIEEILRRPAFSGFTETNLRAVAERPGVVLMFDSWNELGSDARRRARVEIQNLRAELPAATFIATTRPEISDVPFDGQLLTVLELSEQQQIDIAREIKGEHGVRLVDEAWRTPGVRELVTTPLYLTALLSLPDGQPFPRTKEEVLRRFIDAHERQAQHTEPLKVVTHGLQGVFLSDLAVTATHAASTSIPDTNARRSIAQTDEFLVADGQLTIKPQPSDVLDALVSHHLLVRTGEPVRYRFQHQQFQEWYASTDVERAMLEGVDDADALQKLKADILNSTPWQESILFAVERTARGDEQRQKACGVAILAAFEVDPILAADMIFRSTDAVWAQISEEIQKLVRRWHTPGKIDRAVRFMITSGRSEFRDLVWPLITNENNQKSLPALRAARRFRPSVLGPDAVEDILALPLKVRETVVSEIAYRSGMDGLDLAALIAKSDSNPELKAAAVGGMSFRRADRHVADVLSTAKDDTLDLVYRKSHLEDVDDKNVQERLSAARARAEKEGSDYERLRATVYARDGKDHGAELTELVATMEIEHKQGAVVGLIYEACKQYEGAVAQALLKRLCQGRELFLGADNILASSGIVVENGALLDIVLSPQGRMDSCAAAAASVLGPVSVGKLIDAKLALLAEIGQLGEYEKSLSHYYYGLRDRIACAPGASLVAAVQERAAAARNEDIRELAELLCRRDEEGDRARPFQQEAHAAVGQMAAQWGERLIASGDDATRDQLSAVADLIGHFPSVALLPMLKRLLDDELRRYKAFRKQAEAERWRGSAANEARMLYTNMYQEAFTAIKAPETTALMISYLPDEHFGETASRVLKVQWILANEPKDDRRFRGSVDFSHVEEMRAERARCATLTCDEAEAIFEAIAPLISEIATETEKKHAIALAIQAVRLPHGERSDTIKALLSIAPQAARAKLVLNQILSGETIPFNVVQAGINDVFEDAKNHTWILNEGWQLKAWLLLLPFTDHPAQIVDIVAALPTRQREPHFLEELIRASESVQTPEIDEALFKLAEKDGAFYTNHAWRDAVRRRGTPTSARRYLDLVIEGKIDGRDSWHMSREIAGLLSTHSELRDYAYRLLKDGISPKAALLASAVAEGNDPDGLLLLVELETRLQRPLISWQTIRGAVTEHVPSEHWRGAFDVLPVAATELRRKLLAMTTDGGPHDSAARVLREIDRVRDESGAPEDEPRHPDLASGKPWPILVADPDAEDGG
ncbi:NACHT domain-containing protein [Rhizobium leguminosarum]|uniref:NACHT domain-containing protein n=1 Tax=Rhizobium leguminosarum TaxID=384 RepID=UPI003F9A08D9